MPPILQVENLKTHIPVRQGTIKAVDGVDFSLEAGQIMALVGESGSGKSMTGFSIMRLLDAPAHIVAGSIHFKGQNLRALDGESMRRLRGNRIAMILQDPMMALNPVLRIDTQMIETVRAHQNVSAQAARRRALEMLERVGIPSPEERLNAYPHQFSGGMRQRVAIAIALLNAPDLIICDEPTTALDVTIQSQILYEMQKLCEESGTALIWITHDLSVVAGLADTVHVMYAGRIVESGSTAEVLESPRHPYTRGLLLSTPAAAARAGRSRRAPLVQIPGMAPSPLELPQGCAFRPRCERAQQDCLDEPPCHRESRRTDAGGSENPAGERSWRCFHPLDGRLTA